MFRILIISVCLMVAATSAYAYFGTDQFGQGAFGAGSFGGAFGESATVAAPPSDGDAILLVSGDNLLLVSGDNLLRQ